MSTLDDTGAGAHSGEHRAVFRPAALPAPTRRSPRSPGASSSSTPSCCVILLGGVIFVQSTRVGLIDERLAGIKQQALIVAGTLAEYTTDDATRSIKVRRSRAAAAPAHRADAAARPALRHGRQARSRTRAICSRATSCRPMNCRRSISGAALGQAVDAHLQRRDGRAPLRQARSLFRGRARTGASIPRSWRP